MDDYSTLGKKLITPGPGLGSFTLLTHTGVVQLHVQISKMFMNKYIAIHLFGILKVLLVEYSHFTKI